MKTGISSLAQEKLQVHREKQRWKTENISTGIKDPVPVSAKEQDTSLPLDGTKQTSSHLVIIFLAYDSSIWLTCEQRVLSLRYFSSAVKIIYTDMQNK